MNPFKNGDGVKCKFWINDLIPNIPMCAFCNTCWACVEKREGVFYDCSSSTSGRRLLILNALRGRRALWKSSRELLWGVCSLAAGGSTLQGGFWPTANWIGARLICPVLTRMDGSGGWIFGVFITGVKTENEGKGMIFMIIVWYGCYGKWVTMAN